MHNMNINDFAIQE